MKLRRWLGWFALGMFGLGVFGADRQIPPGLKAGETLLFLGDSITHQCLYTRYVALFYMTRYPAVPLHFYNSGVGGDQAADALKRFEYDVAALQPACVTVLLGMNDARYRPLGEPQFGIYKTNMSKLVDRLLQETGAKVFLLTPTMYDYQAAVKRRGRGIETYNDALIAFGDYLRSLGKQRGLPVVDMNTPLREVTAALRKKDPKVTVVPDGVHPSPPGHLVMAYTILKAFGVTPVVACVTIDAGGGVKTERATVEHLKQSPAAVEFDLLEGALPFPYPEDARMVLPVLPFTRDLNRETLTVQDLEPGRYRIEIDGTGIGVWDAKELAAGVNLSENERTPQYRQAVRVMALNDKRTAIMRKIRNFRLNEKRKGYPRPDGTYPRVLRTRTRTKDGKVRWAPDPEADKRFMQERKHLPERLKQVRALEAQCYEAARPVVHHVRIRRAD